MSMHNTVHCGKKCILLAMFVSHTYTKCKSGLIFRLAIKKYKPTTLVIEKVKKKYIYILCTNIFHLQVVVSE